MTTQAASLDQTATARDRFFLIYTAILLGIVIVGFAPSFFLRVTFDAEPLPLYLHLHGAVLTGWFVCLHAQAWLIRSDNLKLHRRVGSIAAAYAAIVVVAGLSATFNVVPRALERGVSFDADMATINPALGTGISYLDFVSGVVWGNIVSVISFALLLALAIYFRRRGDVHKRLILIATVSILGPALARISRLEVFGGEQGPFIPAALLTLLLSIVVYDLVTLRKVHRATLAGAIFFISLMLIRGAIAGSQFGQDFVRSLA